MKMQSVNLFPPEILLQRRHAVILRRSMILMAAVSALVAGLLGLQRVHLASLRAEQQQMNETMVANQEMVARIAVERAKQAALEARAAILLNAIDSPRWGKILFELSTIVPEDIWIQSLAFTPQERRPASPSGSADPASATLYDYGEVRIQGGGMGAQSVSRFVEELSKSPHFDKVTPVVTETPNRGRPATYTLVGRLLF